MKFTKNRLLSLLLVLAMLFALATTAFAGNEGSGSGETPTPSTIEVKDSKGNTISDTVNLQYSDSETFTAVVKDSNNQVIANPNITWALTADGDTYLTRSGSTVTADKNALTESAVTLTATVDGVTPALTKSINISVVRKQITLTANSAAITKAEIMSTTGDSIKKDDVKSSVENKLKQLLASVTNGDKLAYSALVDGTNSGTFEDTAKTDGNVWHFKTNISLKSDAAALYAFTTVNDFPCDVKFTKKPSVTISKQPVAVTCKQGDTNKTVSVEVTKDPNDDNTKVSYQWYYSSYSNGSSATAVSESMDGKKATCKIDTSTYGVRYYFCEISVERNDTVPGDKVTTNAVKVDVKAPYRVTITRANTGTNTVGASVLYYAKLEKYTNDGYTLAESGTGKDYTSFAVVSNNSKIAYVTGGSSLTNFTSNSTFYLNMYSEGTTTLYATITGTSVSNPGIEIVGNTISVEAVKVSTLYMNPTTSTYALLDTSTLTNAIYSAVNSSSLAITASSITFKGNAYGTFSSTGSTGTTPYPYSTSSTSNVYFVPSSNYAGFTTPSMYISYDAYTANGKIASGSIYFTAASSITYNATASTPVYFKASDFTDYFTKAVGGSYSSSYYAPSLSYVYFGTPRVSNSSVTSGTLYYNSSYVTSSTQVSAANLGYVSYTPSSSTYTYTVSIPFTAYGTYGYTSTNRSVSGTVTIKVNDGHVITMVGTDFKSASIWSDITSKHPGVSYVSFSQPQSTVGKLYYGYSSIASKGSLVSYTDRFNNSNYNYSYANTIKSIDGIYFVPAADCLDTVTLTYTAYTSATATTGVSDTITFTITKKTASSIFNDVTASNTGKWSADAIDFLARNSIVEGGSYGTFNPNGNMTRGDFVLMLYRMAGKPSVSGISNPFTDVKSTDYYYNAILWAYRNDIVTGVDAKTFAPKKNITREQIAATLYRMAGSPSTSGYLTGYYDYAKIHSYATNAMRWAISNGVITGSNGYLTPTNNATRAQVATMLHRYLTK